jgi:hypothetical protein
MQNYILPPQFDFINNTNIDPMAMYFFEFEYSLDKDDLNYIWQNLAPRNYKKITKQVSSTAHTLGDNQLLSKEEAVDENTRWMVFKVKQRSQKQYEDLIVSQAGQSDTSLFETKTSAYNLEFNWPYDYVSFVETIKFGAEVLYKPPAEGVSDSTLTEAAEKLGSNFLSNRTASPTKTTGISGYTLRSSSKVINDQSKTKELKSKTSTPTKTTITKTTPTSSANGVTKTKTTSSESATKTTTSIKKY